MRQPPCTVALTGGLASGKSTVGRLLGERGVPVFDCDRYVHRLYEPGGAGAAVVVRLFGGGVLDSSGGVDRDALAVRVLSDDDALRRLNGAVHPLVRVGVADWLEALGRAEPPPKLAVVEAALMVETGSAGSYDLLLVVWCTRDQQLERARSRGLADDRVRGLLAAQLELEEKRRRADVVIDNSGTLPSLAAELDRAWAEIEERCRSRRDD